jgi:hypothetical protein
MAHFAKVENGKVVEVIVVNNKVLGANLDFPESESIGQAFIASLSLDGEWLQTSYNGNFRGNYAGIGFNYDKDLDAFIPPKIFNSWILNTSTYSWEAPVPYPEDDQEYYWNESSQSWVLDN